MGHEPVLLGFEAGLLEDIFIMTIESYQVVGHVKWFDPAKGYGFILPEDGSADILLHANVLRNFGQSSVADGTGITVEVAHTERGIQALSVIALDTAVSASRSGLADFVDVDLDLLDETELEPARIKWFDKAKGFGFANVFGQTDDIFVHIEVLRLAGLADLLPGEAVALRAIEGKRGLMAAEVLPWDRAVLEQEDEDA